MSEDKRNEDRFDVSKYSDIELYNILDISNPNDKKDIVNLSLHENINQIVENEKRVLILMKEIQQLINHEIPK